MKKGWKDPAIKDSLSPPPNQTSQETLVAPHVSTKPPAKPSHLAQAYHERRSPVIWRNQGIVYPIGRSSKSRKHSTVDPWTTWVLTAAGPLIRGFFSINTLYTYVIRGWLNSVMWNPQIQRVNHGTWASEHFGISGRSWNQFPVDTEGGLQSFLVWFIHNEPKIVLQENQPSIQ